MLLLSDHCLVRLLLMLLCSPTTLGVDCPCMLCNLYFHSSNVPNIYIYYPVNVGGCILYRCMLMTLCVDKPSGCPFVCAAAAPAAEQCCCHLLLPALVCCAVLLCCDCTCVLELTWIVIPGSLLHYRQNIHSSLSLVVHL